MKSQRLLLWTNCELSAGFGFFFPLWEKELNSCWKAVQSLHHFQKWEVGSCPCCDMTPRSLWCLWKFYSNLYLNLSFLLAHSTPQSLHVSIILILKILYTNASGGSASLSYTKQSLSLTLVWLAEVINTTFSCQNSMPKPIILDEKHYFRNLYPKIFCFSPKSMLLQAVTGL